MEMFQMIIMYNLFDAPIATDLLIDLANIVMAPRKHLYIPRRFRTIRSFTPDQRLAHFRFQEATDLQRLMQVFDFPETFKRRNGGLVTGEEAVLILLARFTYPSRWAELIEMFGGSPGFLSETFYLALNHIHDNHADELLHNFGRYEPYFQTWAEAIERTRGAYSGDVAFFIDGTLRKMSRPGKHQKEVYSGHKRVHGLKFQSISCPCGLIIDLYGPESGRRHDMHLLRKSTIISRMRTAFRGKVFRLYGDPAYPISNILLRAFRGNMTPEQVQFNKEFNAMRTSVEWAFGKVVKYT